MNIWIDSEKGSDFCKRDTIAKVGESNNANFELFLYKYEYCFF